ncbi:TetR/AcrR family transcriptional regulator [Bogoriella caseilytica]|uniref:TetR family transcriptional regulator n=1 Tax=Bogoriella caseilytica TaxID=56055 RepID=A0A3N2BBE0_9MICO|nr:TetR/AcrR family transcriptional regulator [Bogoriella caseilytica]ROR72548.1 TetR family transcriptional regulator [Bogoriella caseilytica]
MLPTAQSPATDGRTARWTAHRASRHAELVRAARHAIHEQGPEASMAEIAAHAGISKPVLYRYFHDKNGLRDAVGRAVLRRMHDGLEQAATSASGPRERIAGMVEVYLEMANASPNVYAFVVRDSELGSFVGEVVDLVIDAVRPALPDEDSSLDERLRPWAAGVVGLVRGAVEEWLNHPGALQREDVAGQLTTWLWDGAAGLLRRARNGAGLEENRSE